MSSKPWCRRREKLLSCVGGSHRRSWSTSLPPPAQPQAKARRLRRSDRVNAKTIATAPPPTRAWCSCAWRAFAVRAVSQRLTASLLANPIRFHSPQSALAAVAPPASLSRNGYPTALPVPSGVVGRACVRRAVRLSRTRARTLPTAGSYASSSAVIHARSCSSRCVVTRRPRLTPTITSLLRRRAARPPPPPTPPPPPRPRPPPTP